MNIFEKLENAEHTFAGWTQKVLTSILQKTPTFLQLLDTTLSYGSLILPLIPGPGEAEAEKIVTEALQDITVVRAVITDAGPVLSAKGLLQSVNDNLTSLLTDAHVSNPGSVALVKKVLQEIAVLLTNFPATTVPEPTGASATVAVPQPASDLTV